MQDLNENFENLNEESLELVNGGGSDSVWYWIGSQLGKAAYDTRNDVFWD